MERRGNGQHHGALGARLRSELDDALHRRGMAGNHGLFGRIQICGRNDFAAAGLLANFGDIRGTKAQNRGHRAFARRHRFLHVASALPNKLHGRRKFQRARGNQRGIFAQAVARHKIRFDAVLCEHTIGGHRNCQDCRLRIGGELQLFFGALKTHFGNGKSQRGIGFVEHRARCRKIIGEFLAHAGILRSLSGKKKCEFSHDVDGFLPAQPRAGTAAAGDSSCSIFSFTRARQSSAATRMAFLIALGLERPCPITVTPRTPSSGAPPYSE